MTICHPVSQRLTFMALACAFGVVFIHVPAPESPMARFVWGYFSHGIAKVAVPFFFVAAGYLLAGRIGENGWYHHGVVKRVKSLLVPLIIWDVLWYAFAFLTSCKNAYVGGDGILALPPLSVSAILRILALHPFAQPYLGVLWFVRTLFVLVLASPLLVRLSTPLCLAIMFLAKGALYPDYGGPCDAFVFTFQEGFLSVFGAVYFCLGIWLRKKGIDVEYSWKVGFPALLLGIGLIVLRGMPYQSLLSRQITWLMIPILLVGVWWLVPSVALPRWLTGAAFAVYTLHMFIISISGAVAKTLKAGWLIGPDCSAAGYVLSGILVTGYPVDSTNHNILMASSDNG